MATRREKHQTTVAEIISSVIPSFLRDYGPEISEEMRQERHRKLLENRAAYHNNKLKLFDNPNDGETKEKIKEYEKSMGLHH